MQLRSLTEAFKRGWKSGGNETKCGVGSTMSGTSRLRKLLPDLLKELKIKSINDAGCGDLNWISTIDLASFDYFGVDVVKHESWENYPERPQFNLCCADICAAPLRPADLTICRDVLMHLPNGLVNLAICNFRMASKYLLATSFEGVSNVERDIQPGEFAELDLMGEPIKLGTPLLQIQEKRRGKYLGLWSLIGVGENQ